MSNDLVAHLRKSATEPCDGCCYGESMVKAAAEIERLRAMHQDMCGVAGRLVEALEKIYRFADTKDGHAEVFAIAADAIHQQEPKE